MNEEQIKIITKKGIFLATVEKVDSLSLSHSRYTLLVENTPINGTVSKVAKNNYFQELFNDFISEDGICIIDPTSGNYVSSTELYTHFIDFACRGETRGDTQLCERHPLPTATASTNQTQRTQRTRMAHPRKWSSCKGGSFHLTHGAVRVQPPSARRCNRRQTRNHCRGRVRTRYCFVSMYRPGESPGDQHARGPRHRQR